MSRLNLPALLGLCCMLGGHRGERTGAGRRAASDRIVIHGGAGVIEPAR